MLSNFLTGRDANRGACTQPCRWNYTIYEEKRPDIPIPVEQSELGTFIMSSKDMCTIEHIPELIEAGISSFKIEGRMKSVYYTSVVTNAYRMAIDKYYADPDSYEFDPAWLRELESVSHREYCTGFYFDDMSENAQLSSSVGYIREKAYFAVAVTPDADEAEVARTLEAQTGERYYLFMQKNKISVGDRAEVISPSVVGRPLEIDRLFDGKGAPIECAPHPFMRFFVPSSFEIKEGDILRSGDSE